MLESNQYINIGAYKNLKFIGMGRDLRQDKFLIFEDPIDGFLVISKDEYYSTKIQQLL